MPSTRRRWPFVLLAVVGLLVAALAALSLAGNLMRGPLERFVSARLDRPFKIHGGLGLRLLPPLGVTVEGVELGNPPGVEGPPMLALERGTVRLSLLPLLRGRLEVQRAELVRPRVFLARDADGQANWNFEKLAEMAASPEKRPPPPTVGRLHIEDGEVVLRDAVLPAELRLAIASAPAAADGREQVRIEGKGTLRKAPVTIDGTAGSPTSLAESRQPFPLRMEVRAGNTGASFDGTFEPSRVGRIDGRAKLSGADLAELGSIARLPIPWTPRYAFAGRVTRESAVWTVHELEGTMGNSDIAGRVSLEEGKPPRLRGELVSRRLDYRDLGGIVGLPPGGRPTQAASAAQRAEAERRKQSPRRLPDKTYDLQALRRLDAEVDFRATRFTATQLPLEGMAMHISLAGGALAVRPFGFSIAGGKVSGAMRVDARRDVMRASADLTVRSVDVGRAFPALKPPRGATGKLTGRARLEASGNSVAALLGTLDGDVAMISAGGTASALTLVLSDLDLARAASLLVRGDESAAVHCVVGDFGAKQGVLALRTLVADTEVEKIEGRGQVDFRTERYDLQLAAHSKQPTLALQGPINVKGTFARPEVLPAVAPVAARLGAAVALGVVATPIAALIPLIDPGLAEDSDCAALIGAADRNVAASRAGRAATKAVRGSGSPPGEAAAATKPSAAPR
jgi:uncharacterized protein involved in outer membrane biogenesis